MHSLGFSLTQLKASVQKRTDAGNFLELRPSEKKMGQMSKIERTPVSGPLNIAPRFLAGSDGTGPGRSLRATGSTRSSGGKNASERDHDEES